MLLHYTVYYKAFGVILQNTFSTKSSAHCIDDNTRVYNFELFNLMCTIKWQC